LNDGESRSRAAGTLRNLAASQNMPMLLISYKNGSILDALLKAALNKSDAKASYRAIGVFENCLSNETVEIMAQHDGLLLMLGTVASRSKYTKIRTVAASTLKKFSSKINYPSPSHSLILRSIVETQANNKNQKNDLLMSEALLIQSRNSSNLLPITKCQGLVEAIASITASADMKSRENILEVMKKLASYSGTKSIIGLNSVFIDAVVSILRHEGSDNEKGMADAVHIISTLSSFEKNRYALANHEGLIEVMVPYARSIENTKARTAAVNCVAFLMQSMLSLNNQYIY